MSKINIRESLRNMDADSCCKYDLLTMYDACPLTDEDKADIAKLLFDHEDPEVIYQKLCTYFCDDDVSELTGLTDIQNVTPSEAIINNVKMGLDQKYDSVFYNDVAGQFEIKSKDTAYTFGLSPVEYETDGISLYVDYNYDMPINYTSIKEASEDILNKCVEKVSTASQSNAYVDDDTMDYIVYDVVEDEGRLCAKCMNESTNSFEDIKLGKVNSDAVNELLNNILNNPNYKLTNDCRKKIADNSAPWGIVMSPGFDITASNALMSTGDFGGSVSFGESEELTFEKGDRVTDGNRKGTVIDCDSIKVLVDWDYSETDDIEWVMKEDLSFVNALKESEKEDLHDGNRTEKDLIDAGYKYVASNSPYDLYRKIVGGKGDWYAVNYENNTVQHITYAQARGDEPIDDKTGIKKLSMELGKKLLPQNESLGDTDCTESVHLGDVVDWRGTPHVVVNNDEDEDLLTLRPWDKFKDSDFDDDDEGDNSEDVYISPLQLKESVDDGWVKRWSFADKWYKGPFVISKNPEPYRGYHLEKVKPNGATAKHYGNFNSIDDAKAEASRYLKESADDGVDSNRFLPNMEYCPACGGTRFNVKTGVCADCGYDEGDWGYTGTDDLDEESDIVEEDAEGYVNLREAFEDTDELQMNNKYDNDIVTEGIFDSKETKQKRYADTVKDVFGEDVNVVANNVISYASDLLREVADSLGDESSSKNLGNSIIRVIKNAKATINKTPHSLVRNIASIGQKYERESINLKELQDFLSKVGKLQNSGKDGYKAMQFLFDKINNSLSTRIDAIIKTITNEYGLIRESNESIQEDDDLISAEQEFDSAATSINSNKLPAVYSMVRFNPGDVVVDFGGGKFDNAVNYLKDNDVTLLVYDPYNRSAEHNKEVLRILKEHGGADAAVNSNVLNVIKEPEAREAVLRNIKKITKRGAPIYITVYEGRGDGAEGPTKSGYQLNRKTSDYMDEIGKVFSNVKRKGKLITAINESTNMNESIVTDASNIGQGYAAPIMVSLVTKAKELAKEYKNNKDKDGFERLLPIFEDNILDYKSEIEEKIKDFDKYWEVHKKAMLDNISEAVSILKNIEIPGLDSKLSKLNESYSGDEWIDRMWEAFEGISGIKDISEGKNPNTYVVTFDTDGSATARARILLKALIKANLDIELDSSNGSNVFTFITPTNEWEFIKGKMIKDSDGFLTSYDWYRNTDSGLNIFMFGADEADPDYADWETESDAEAEDWFNSYTGFDEEELDESVKSSATAEVISKELKDAAYKLFKTPEWGFETDKEIKDYINPFFDVSEDPKTGDIELEVRAELDYDNLMELADVLNKVVEEYDRNSYFDAEQPGIISAFIRYE